MGNHDSYSDRFKSSRKEQLDPNFQVSVALRSDMIFDIWGNLRNKCVRLHRK